jgi:hypothetical protein
MSRSVVAMLVGAGCFALLPSMASGTSFDLGSASNFVLLGDNPSNLGTGGSATDIAGNIGVGAGGKLTVNGSTLTNINGNIAGAMIDGGAAQNASLVSAALDALCNHTSSETGACGAGSVFGG